MQKLPDLLPVIHLLIEKKCGWKFILTGSSSRKLKRSGVNLLGGRAFKKVMRPFMAAELGDKFSLDDALLYGLLPLRFGSVDPGVYRALRPFSIHDARTELEGIALEGLVAEHLQAWKDYTEGKHTLHFWRTKSGVEVDFVVLGPLGFLGY